MVFNKTLDIYNEIVDKFNSYGHFVVRLSRGQIVIEIKEIILNKSHQNSTKS